MLGVRKGAPPSLEAVPRQRTPLYNCPVVDDSQQGAWIAEFPPNLISPPKWLFSLQVCLYKPGEREGGAHLTDGEALV